MPRQAAKPTEERKPLYDIKDPKVRDFLRTFEAELMKFEGPYRFDLYCLKKGIIRGKIVRKKMATGEYDSVEVISVNQFYGDECEKYRALQSLWDARAYAKKMQHLEQLGGQECTGKPGTKMRCTICYPLTIAEHYEKTTGKRFPFKRPEPIKADSNPGADAEGVDVAAIEICDKCGELKDECRCIKESDLPF